VLLVNLITLMRELTALIALLSVLEGQQQIPFGNDRQEKQGQQQMQEQRQKQIPCGNDRQKGKSKDNGKSNGRFASGRTGRKTRVS
jgi:hypothetical protein